MHFSSKETHGLKVKGWKKILHASRNKQEVEYSSVYQANQDYYITKKDNLEEINKFLGTHSLPRLNQEEIENLNRLITSKKILSIITN